MGREMLWPVVGRKYLESFQRARRERKVAPRSTFAQWTLDSRPYDLPPLRLDHIERMSDATGILQHATFNVPNYHEGYCTDDNARAYLLCNLLDETGGRPPSQSLDRLAMRYLAFLSAALNPESGRFRNFMTHGRHWLEAQGSEDSHARALWALGTGSGRSRNPGHRKLSALLFTRGLGVVGAFQSPRAWAFSLLGIHEYLLGNPARPDVSALRASLTRKLLGLWRLCSTESWPWFEPCATYDNARLAQGLILTGVDAPDAEALEVGLKALRWLVSVQKAPAGHFRPIGNNGFYGREGAHADFDQQPVEAQAMVSACLDAHRATRDPAWFGEAKRAFEWFLGRNDLGLAVYDASTGGCGDGLQEDRISENQGAESTLAFHLALAEMNESSFMVGTAWKRVP
jgi:hypothetical protein